ncbi:hypothetical protein BSR29_01220 [Boudabousia liubingyangii]|uniref:Histidine phosphatase family protein n=1 Tax=Boudabousia liubingyangii TaxID=1921764 RepID=A0A1Q5PPT1_9ACTO|nr:histidine phosphatase family protein [Boudabousia liubingyangii]OKL49608.1 hypothetical protein BSR29_01220 [Boudabousia liubingyangii]
MKLLLIRHAESQNNALMASGRIEERVPDPHISELGQKQAQALADFYATKPAGYPIPDEIQTSLMIRTIQTATPLADQLDLPMTARMDTFERRGVFEGVFDTPTVHPGSPRSTLQAVTPRVTLPEGATEEGWWKGPFENQRAGLIRAQKVVKDLRKMAQDVPPGYTLALVSHGEFLAMLITTFMEGKRVQQIIDGPGDPDTAFRRMDRFIALENTSTSLLEIMGQDFTMTHWINRIDHLFAAGLAGQGASSEDTAAV